MPRETPSLFFFNDTATTEIYTLSLHDALPISLGFLRGEVLALSGDAGQQLLDRKMRFPRETFLDPATAGRSEEHTSELQSQSNIVCRLLLEKKKHQVAKSISHPCHARDCQFTT